MVVDSSAVVAVLLAESDARAIQAAFRQDPDRAMGAPTLVELGLVIEARLGGPGREVLDDFRAAYGLEIVPFDEDLAERAREAWRRFGKGRHPAALNFGDCLTYALADRLGEPILCVGDDFARTDAALVLPSGP